MWLDVKVKRENQPRELLLNIPLFFPHIYAEKSQKNVKCEIILKAVDTQGVQGAVATCFNLSSELVWTQVPSDHHIFEDNLLERELPENNLIQTCNFQKKKGGK